MTDPMTILQVLADAKAVDELKASGHDTKPLCGLPFAVKDNIDVVGYPTVAGTPALHGTHLMISAPRQNDVHQNMPRPSLTWLSAARQDLVVS